MSSQTTTQKLQTAHVRHLITITMPATADQSYDDASNEPDNPGNASDERPSHDVRNLPLDICWW
ncbi:hypothetical protein WKK05_39660 (plasmid) [Nostoc sp. UHCC 0302]|uniref:hypothetical protein n=1 Tax=Nostoc sp. UHCC 0302 TaxID=3134896 RepID=UPI00311CA626